MRLFARAAKNTVRDGQARGRTNEPDAVAGRVDEAILDDRVVPVTACNGIVAGEELAADDLDVLAPAFGRAAPMDAVPAPNAFHVAKLDVVADLKEHRVVRRVE